MKDYIKCCNKNFSLDKQLKGGLDLAQEPWCCQKCSSRSLSKINEAVLLGEDLLKLPAKGLMSTGLKQL